MKQISTCPYVFKCHTKLHHFQTPQHPFLKKAKFARIRYVVGIRQFSEALNALKMFNSIVTKNCSSNNVNLNRGDDKSKVCVQYQRILLSIFRKEEDFQSSE